MREKERLGKTGGKTMKRMLFALLVLACVLACGTVLADVLIDDTAFPDEHFRQYVLRFDEDHDMKLSDAELNAVTEISFSDEELASLTGIEHFTQLEYLICGDNKLTELDLRALKNLTYLRCDWGRLERLDVTGLTALTGIQCDHNPLTVLDLTTNVSLEFLQCEFCHIASLNLSNCPKLSALYCKDNELVSLVLGPHEDLEHLDCQENKLTTLDVSGNPHIYRLSCSRNHLTSLTLGEIPQLISLTADENKLLSLDLSGVPNLIFLDVAQNDLTELDISPCPAIEMIRVPEFYEHNDYSHYYIYYAYMFGSDPDHWFSCDDDVRIITAGLPIYPQPETDFQEIYAYLSPLNITITSDTDANCMVWIGDEDNLMVCNMFDGWEYEPGITTHTLYMGKSDSGDPYLYLEPGAYDAAVFLFRDGHMYSPYHYHFRVENYFIPKAEWHLSTEQPTDQKAFDVILDKQYDAVQIKIHYYDDEGNPWEAPEGHTALDEALVFENTDRVSLYLTRQGWYSMDLTCRFGEDWTEPLNESIYVEEGERIPEADLILPADLIRIEDEAFLDVKEVVIRLSESVEYISDSAFDPSVTIIAPLDSAAYQRCKDLGLTVYGD